MNSSMDREPNPGKSRRGAIAVVPRVGRLLVIRRSAHVVAPGAYCFPGGGIEGDEAETTALVRELREELGVDVEPVRRLWTSTTRWNVELAWWLAALPASVELVPNPAEVAQATWLSVEELGSLPGLLSSNLEFLAAWRRGEFLIDGVEPPGSRDAV